ncbi:MAG: bifunctional phosphoribosylaminoimidazolecarboxamide formyltransferase/IMP cyclohydrolase [Betaproteobacteria bacterium]|nr:bifunctional phosphoribosylaminoimidazolecarboxamide formyltransferase/IMP cyclohydrolase [Betaproteobacteria bacterium]
MKIKTALVSVADKSGLPELARALQKHRITAYSTGGTAKVLRENGLETRDISELTGFSEILDGRVKTLHPHVHAAILADTGNAAHMQTLEKMGVPPIDLVAVNFYPFEKAAESGGDDAKIIENIDIGGPAMARAAAKNFACTAVLTDPLDYPAFIGEMERAHGEISPLHTRILAAKAFVAVAHLDAAIANYFSAEGDFSAHLFLHLHKQMDLKYGENPHQTAACYEKFGGGGGYAQFQGAALSYNNLLDAQAACGLAGRIEEPAAVIVKHNNPCGAAAAENIRQAFYMARRCDPDSTFGGIVALNREVDGDTAEALSGVFLEAVLAPQFTSEAKEIFAARSERLRVLLSPVAAAAETEIRGAGGVFLAQTPDALNDESEWEVVTQAHPDENHWRDLRFAWRVAMTVKSNAIVAAKECATLGIGAGQMSRIDSARLACQKAERVKLKLDNAAAASDAFFPFADGLAELAKAGVKAVIQPGGSIRDKEVIDEADKSGIAMVFTKRRHFRH